MRCRGRVDYTMAEIKFKNLKSLVHEMNLLNWMIYSFQFEYKKKEYFVLVTLYDQNESKPDKYAIAKIEIIDKDDTKRSIKGYSDLFEVHFATVSEFCSFFVVSPTGNCRDLFIDFSNVFNNFIPKNCNRKLNNQEEKIILKRIRNENVDALYCYDVRRNGKNEQGKNNIRSNWNSQKAYILRKSLYNRFKDDMNLSFFFSPNQEDEKSDNKIIEQFHRRYK